MGRWTNKYTPGLIRDISIKDNKAGQIYQNLDHQVYVRLVGDIFKVKINETEVLSITEDGSDSFVPDQTGSSGYYLTTDGVNSSWTPVISGDVTGPSSAVDENITVFDNTTGKLIKDSGVNISSLISNTTIRSGQESLTAGSNNISFSSDIGTSSWIFTALFPYDSSGNMLMWQITSRTSGGFSITVPLNGTLDYKIELI